MKDQPVIYRTYLKEYQCVGYGNTPRESVMLCGLMYLAKRTDEDKDKSFTDAWDYYGGQIERCESGKGSLEYDGVNFLDYEDERVLLNSFTSTPDTDDEIYLDEEDELYGKDNPYEDWSEDAREEELYNLENSIVQEWLDSKPTDNEDKMKHGQLLWLK